MADTQGSSSNLASKLAERRKRNSAAGQQRRMIRGPGGQLQEVTGEEVQTLSSKLGRTAPPTSPLAGQQMGLTPDQAKMVGDGRQKAAALDIGLGGESQVQREERRDLARTEATEGERAAIEKSENLQRLGSTGDKVHELVNREFEKLRYQTDEQGNFILDEQGNRIEKTPTTLSDIQVADTPALAQLRAQPTADGTTNPLLTAVDNLNAKVLAGNKDIRAEVAAVMNAITVPEGGSLTAELQKYLPADVANAVAGATLDYSDITVDKLVTDLGYTGPELEGLLGLPAGGLEGMTVSQLQDAVSATIASDLNAVSELQRMLADPTTPAALRDEAREALADAGAVGVRFAEQQADELSREIESGTTITVNGRDYTIEELLNDENITDIVAEYLLAEDPPGSGTIDWVKRNKLIADNPQLENLYKFAEKYQDLLTQGLSTVETTQAGLEKDLEYRQSVDAELGGLLSKLTGNEDWKKYGGDISLSSSILQKTLMDPNSTYMKETAAALKQLEQQGLDISKLTDDQLNKLGITDQGVTSTFNEYILDKKMTDANNLDEFAQSLGIEDGSLQDTVSKLVSGVGPAYADAMGQYEKDMQAYRDSLESWKTRRKWRGEAGAGPRPVPPTKPALDTLGLSESDITMLELFDSDLDGQVDDWTKIDERLEKLLAGGEPSQELGALRSSLAAFSKDTGISDRTSTVSNKVSASRGKKVTSKAEKTLRGVVFDTAEKLDKWGNSDEVRAKKDEALSLIKEYESIGTDKLEEADMNQYLKLKDFVSKAETKLDADDKAWYNVAKRDSQAVVNGILAQPGRSKREVIMEYMSHPLATQQMREIYRRMLDRIDRYGEDIKPELLVIEGPES